VKRKKKNMLVFGEYICFWRLLLAKGETGVLPEDEQEKRGKALTRERRQWSQAGPWQRHWP
jgi:hypothetical protein